MNHHSDGGAAPESSKLHCCDSMLLAIRDERTALRYDSRRDEYRLEDRTSTKYAPELYLVHGEPELISKLFFAGDAGLAIRYCPWCGKRLISSKREEWVDVDVLTQLSTGIMTEEDAIDCERNAEFAAWYDGRPKSISARLGMSEREYRARLHGISFTRLMSWRRDGWPSKCATCGEEIDTLGSGWFVQECEEDGETPAGVALYHAQCFDPESYAEIKDNG